MVEKRNFSRVGFKVTALLQSEGMAVKGEVKDVSLHGLYLATDQELAVGTPVEITIYLSSGIEPVVINVSGRVARRMPGGVGCTFEKIDAESFAHLRSVISYQGGDESKVMAEFTNYMSARSNHDAH